MKKIVSLLLSFVTIFSMTLGLPMNLFAANQLSYSAAFNPTTVTASEADQSVTVVISSETAFRANSINAVIDLPEGWTLTALTNSSVTAADVNVNLSNGTLVWANLSNNNGTVENLTEVLTATFTVPAGTAADSYEIRVSNIAIAADGSFTEVTTADSFTATLTIVDGTPGGETPSTPTDKPYTADLDTTSSAVKVGDTITVDVLVGGTTGQFASAELDLTYTGLEFDSGTASVGDEYVNFDADNTKGTLKITDYGESYTWAENGNVTAYTLKFKVADLGEEASGTANVTIAENGAAFSTAANAATQDLSTATVTINEKVFSVTPADLSVTLPEGFTSNATGNKVEYGKTVTIEATNKYYDYELTFTGTDQNNITDNGDGTWTIINVTEDIEVKITKQTGKEFTITFSDPTHILNQSEATVKVNYDTDFVFTLQPKVEPETGKDGIQYLVESIKYTGTENDVNKTNEGTKYTIPGSAITADITITTKTEILGTDTFTVGVEGDADDLNAPTSANKGETITLTLTPEAGYKYTVSYQMGEADAVEITTWTEVEGGKKTATISNITANVTVNVVKTVDTSAFTIEVKGEYLAWEETVENEIVGKEMHLVVITNANLAAGKIYTYDGQNMFYSKKYSDEAGAYVYLVITNANADFTAETALEKVGIATATAVEVVYNGDVNKVGTSNTVDANDAQLVWNMYNGAYNGFDKDVTMEKFLRADMTGDGKIDVNDAAAVITIIQAATATN